MKEKEGKKKETYLARLEGLAERCLICGALLTEQPEKRGFYYETSDRASRGFLHNDCFTDLLCATLYGITSQSQAYGTARIVIADRALKAVSLFFPRSGENTAMLDYRQFSLEGEQLFCKDIPMQGFSEGEFNGTNDRLFLLLNEALAGYEGSLREGTWLVVHPVDAGAPEAILQDERYRSLLHIQEIISEQLETSASA